MIDQAKLLLFLEAQYGFSIYSMQTIPYGAINISYQIETNKGLYFVREYSPLTYLGAKTYPQIGEEMNYLKLLSENSVLVPLPVLNVNAEEVSNYNGIYVVVFDFIHGHHLLGNIHEEYSFTIGETVAKMHNTISTEKVRTNKGWHGRSFLEHAMDTFKKSNHPTYYDELQSIIEQREKLQSKLSREMFAIHGDVHLGNILLNRKNEIVIIDFDSLQTGHFEQDLANHIVMTVFKSVLTDLPYQMNRKIAQEFLRGYAQEIVSGNFDEELLLFYCKITRILLLLDYEGRMPTLEIFATKSTKVLQELFHDN